jgi:hypothetical protein
MHAAQEQAKAAEDQKKAKEMEVCTNMSHSCDKPTFAPIHTSGLATNMS